MSNLDVSVVKSLLTAEEGDVRANVLNAFSYIRLTLGENSWVGLYRKEDDGLHLFNRQAAESLNMVVKLRPSLDTALK